jgi:hypothetical protein
LISDTTAAFNEWILKEKNGKKGDRIKERELIRIMKNTRMSYSPGGISGVHYHNDWLMFKCTY